MAEVTLADDRIINAGTLGQAKVWREFVVRKPHQSE
jgi:hypothetical protein